MAMDIGATIGERITFFRELAGWSRKDLWAATGITYNRIGKLETGVSKPYHWEMELIALHLNQPLNYFDTRRPVSFTITVQLPGATDAPQAARPEGFQRQKADRRDGRGMRS